MTYTMPTALNPTDSAETIAANLALFLKANGESVTSDWGGRMRAADQRRLFGAFLGKGTVVVDGGRDQVRHVKTVCFGTDVHTTATIDLRARLAKTDGSRHAEVEALAARLAGPASNGKQELQNRLAQWF